MVVSILCCIICLGVLEDKNKKSPDLYYDKFLKPTLNGILYRMNGFARVKTGYYKQLTHNQWVRGNCTGMPYLSIDACGFLLVQCFGLITEHSPELKSKGGRDYKNQDKPKPVQIHNVKNTRTKTATRKTDGD